MSVNFTPLDTHERHAYVDRSLEAASAEFNNPEVLAGLGSIALMLQQRISSAVVVNIRAGAIQAPCSTDEDVLPVVAVNPGEEVGFLNYFDGQTSQQMESTVSLFKLWRPAKGRSAKQVYEEIFPDLTHDERPMPTYKITDLTRAATGTAAAILRVDQYIQPHFLGAPDQGIMVVKKRPTLMLVIDEEIGLARPEDVAHELVHVDQVDRSPVDVVTNQKRADMLALRSELEAYQVGAAFTNRRYKQLGRGSGVPIPHDHGLVQASVELIRKKHHGSNPVDPFAPSPALLKKLAAAGLEDVLHARMIYDQLCAIANQT